MLRMIGVSTLVLAFSGCESTTRGVDDWHTWTREVIDTNGAFSLTISADRASDDTVFVAYFDETSQQLRLATRDSGKWQVETVIASTGGETQVYQKVRLRVDANKTPHLAFQDYDLRAIRYATYAK